MVSRVHHYSMLQKRDALFISLLLNRRHDDDDDDNNSYYCLPHNTVVLAVVIMSKSVFRESSFDSAFRRETKRFFCLENVRPSKNPLSRSHKKINPKLNREDAY